MVTAQFEKFNANYKQLEVVFQEVTGRAFKAGQEFSVMEIRNGQVMEDFQTNIERKFSPQADKDTCNISIAPQYGELSTSTVYTHSNGLSPRGRLPISQVACPETRKSSALWDFFSPPLLSPFWLVCWLSSLVQRKVIFDWF